jgi:hypothetical protein
MAAWHARFAVDTTIGTIYRWSFGDAVGLLPMLWALHSIYGGLRRSVVR